MKCLAKNRFEKLNHWKRLAKPKNPRFQTYVSKLPAKSPNFLKWLSLLLNKFLVNFIPIGGYW